MFSSFALPIIIVFSPLFQGIDLKISLIAKKNKSTSKSIILLNYIIFFLFLTNNTRNKII